ncbi:hypothetical protein CSUI_004567 [Cystoisospora suis]|uniref:Uncharacterized protein n=1 Tax=Cystoisospora suis TaxID=483139 RepID=A0A2C6KM92_9APIC|nr:hypothetical protein CSUI_004567 [Cystoisospora suis]
MRSLTREIMESVPPPLYGGVNKNWSDGICLDGVLADALRSAGAHLEFAGAAQASYVSSLLSRRQRQAGRTSVASGRGAATRQHPTPLASGWLDKDLDRELTLSSAAQPSATGERDDPTRGVFAAGVRDLTNFYVGQFELTSEVLESQRVTVQRLLLSHPHPDSFARAALFRQRSVSYFSLLEPDVLKVLVKRLVFTLHGLTNAVSDDTAEGEERARGEIWDDLLSTLGELDAVLWALPTASESATRRES